MDVQLLAAFGVTLVLAGIAALLAHVAGAPPTVRPPTPDDLLVPADPVRIAFPGHADVPDEFVGPNVLLGVDAPAHGNDPG